MEKKLSRALISFGVTSNMDLTQKPGESTASQYLASSLWITLDAPVTQQTTLWWQTSWFKATASIVGILVFFLLLALLLLLCLRKKKELTSLLMMEETTSSTATTPKSTTSASKKKVFVKEGEKDPASYKVRHHAVNAEYIMEGVVNVKIVDVDPSKRAERKQEADSMKSDGMVKTKSTGNLTKTTTTSRFWCFPTREADGTGRRRCPCC